MIKIISILCALFFASAVAEAKKVVLSADPPSTATGIIAAPGCPGNVGTPLTADWNEVTVVANNFDCVALPQCVTGAETFVSNADYSKGNYLGVVPFLGETDRFEFTDPPYALGGNAIFRCITPGLWHVIKGVP